MSKTSLIATVIILSMGVCIVDAFAQTELGVQIPELAFNPPDVERFQLDNGLVVYFYEDHALPVVTVDMMIRTGEMYVPADKVGLAALSGTLLRSGGTKSTPPDEFDSELDFIGSTLRSSADVESASIGLRTLRQYADRSVALMAEMIEEPRFDPDKLAIARENMIEGIRRENDNPHNVVRREFYKRLFPDHPYGNTATIPSVESISRDDILKLYNRTYRPDQTVLAISGDMTRVEAEVMIRQYLSDWRSIGTETLTAPELKPATPGVYHIQKEQDQTYFRFGHRGITLNDPNRYAVEVMNYILGGGGFTSRLTSTVRVERGLAYSVGSRFSNMKDAGAFFAYCQTKAPTTCEALDIMLDVIKKFQAEGPTEKELEVAKNSIINADVFNYATPQQVVTERAMLEFDGLSRDEFKARIDAIQKMTVADVKKAANDFLKPDNLVIIVVGDSAQFEHDLSSYGELHEVELD